jgi:hypothetical protein
MDSRLYVEQLCAILGPLDPPSGPIDWSAVENSLRFVLPSDYKELCRRYLDMQLNRFLVVVHPHPTYEGGETLKTWSERIIGQADDLREEFPETAPYPLFPEEGGVFPWAITVGNDILWWRMVGDPDGWPVIVQARDSQEDDWWEYPCSAAELLVKLTTDQIQCPVFPDFADKPPHPWKTSTG